MHEHLTQTNILNSDSVFTPTSSHPFFLIFICSCLTVEPMQQQTLPQVISQGASQNSGMNPNRIMLQQQPAKPAINVQDGAYAPAKRVVRSQSMYV